jgi:hypothetical protein
VYRIQVIAVEQIRRGIHDIEHHYVDLGFESGARLPEQQIAQYQI